MKRYLERTYGEKKSVAVVCALLCALQTFALFQADSTVAGRPLALFSLILQVLLIASLLVIRQKTFVFNNTTMLCAVSIFMWWVFASFIHGDNVGVFSLIAPIILSFYVLLDKESKRVSFIAWRNVIFYMSIFGIIAYTLYATGIMQPFSMNDFYELDAPAQYANYGLAYVFVPNTAIGFDRLCGLFNEPGMLGTMGAFVLIADGMKVNFKNIVIFIACIMTFSMAFFMLIFFYLALKILFTRDMKTSFAVIIVILIISYISARIAFSDNSLHFFDRFVFENGRFSGDDRISSSDAMIWRATISDPYTLWFGYQGTYKFEGSSYKSLIIHYGLLGFVSIFLPLLWAAFKAAEKNKLCLVLIICFMISVYQRAQIMNVAYFAILFGGIEFIKNTESIQ